MPVGAIISGLITAGSAIAGAISKKRQQKRANKYQREAMELQNQLNKQAVDEQNAYNTPANQMKRFQEAGLNPNLIYSQGTAGNQETAVNYGVPEQSFENYFSEGLGGVGQSLYDMINQYQAVQMNSEQIRAQKIANDIAEYQLPYASNAAYIENRLKNIGLDIAEGTKQQQIAKVAEELSGIELSNELKGKQIELMAKRFEQYEKIFRQMDDQHANALLDNSIKDMQLKIEEDKYQFAMELSRIQGKLLAFDPSKVNSWRDLPLREFLMLGVYYLLGGAGLPWVKSRVTAPKAGKGKTTTKTNFDKDGVQTGGTVTTTTPNK